MNRRFQTSTHSLAALYMITGEYVVSCFPVVDGKVNTDTELFYATTTDPLEARRIFKAERAKIAPPPVTRQRAAAIIEQAQAAHGFGPWCDRLDKVMTVDERAAVKLNWEYRPGNWSFVSTLTAISKGR